MMYEPIADRDLTALVTLVSETFNMPSDGVGRWVDASGRDNWRVLRDESVGLVGALMRIPMAQWYGGRAVPLTGLAGVAVSSRVRGKGVGKRLMAESLREMRSNGAALSALYGSTTSFYRTCGYERAGAGYRLEIPLRELKFRAGPLEVRALDAEGHQRAQALQKSWVTQHACLERGPYLWHRTRNPRGRTTEGFGFYSGDRLEGYLYWVRSEFRGLENELDITDLVLTTADAQNTFLGFLAGYRAFFKKASLTIPASSPLLFALDEPWAYELSLLEHWMLRVVDVERALTERGYPEGVSGSLHFRLEDRLLAENSGDWKLEVRDGRGRVSRGGEPTLILDIGALAPLFSGFQSAENLAVAGKAEGDAETLKTATSLFRGEPRLTDFF